jgi:hypothetical protein
MHEKPTIAHKFVDIQNGVMYWVISEIGMLLFDVVMLMFRCMALVKP